MNNENYKGLSISELKKKKSVMKIFIKIFIVIGFINIVIITLNTIRKGEFDWTNSFTILFFILFTIYFVKIMKAITLEIEARLSSQ